MEDKLRSPADPYPQMDVRKGIVAQGWTKSSNGALTSAGTLHCRSIVSKAASGFLGASTPSPRTSAPSPVSSRIRPSNPRWLLKLIGSIANSMSLTACEDPPLSHHLYYFYHSWCLVHHAADSTIEGFVCINQYHPGQSLTISQSTRG